MPEIITMPEELYAFSAMRFNIVTLTTSSGPGSFNPLIRVDGPSAYVWRARLTITPQEDDQLDELERFITRLKGNLNRALIYDLRKASGPKGAGGVSSTVNIAADAAAGATSLTFKNLQPSEAVALAAMDHFGLGNNLHRIVNSGPSDSGGEGAFEIWPPTRVGVAVDDAVNLSKPPAVFMLESGQDELTIGPAMISSDLTLSFVEDPDFA